VFKNCQFALTGGGAQSATGASSLALTGADYNRFIECTIGADTMAFDADACGILGSTFASKNTFENCIIQAMISAAGYAHVQSADASGFGSWTMFKDCLFWTKSENHATTQTSVFEIHALSEGVIWLINSFAGCDEGTAAEWDSNNRTCIYNNSVAAAASAAGGILTRQ
jgi:hypothetical protein